MANLLEDLKKNMAATPNVPKLGETSRLSQLVKAAQGQQMQRGAAGEAAVDETAELAAQAETQAQTQAQALEGQAAAVRLEQTQAAQDTQYNQEAQSLDEKTLNSQIDAQNRSASLLTKVSQDRAQFDLKKKSSTVEFAVAQMRLSNDKYLSQLQMEGKRRRLNNELTLRMEYTKTALGNNFQIFKDDLNHRASLAALIRGQKVEISKYSVEQALALAKSSSSAAQTNAQYRAVGEVIKASAEAAQRLIPEEKTPSTPTPTPTPAGGK